MECALTDPPNWKSIGHFFARTRRMHQYFFLSLIGSLSALPLQASHLSRGMKLSTMIKLTLSMCLRYPFFLSKPIVLPASLCSNKI